MTAQLSVVIPCKDEEHNILQCIASVQAIADEIVVADSGSTDRTLELVSHWGGCRIVQREFVSFSSFKSWAIAQATHPWVLTLDADERLTPAGVAEIKKLLADGPAQDGYNLSAIVHFLGHPLRHGSTRGEGTVRLFRNEVASYNDRTVHESVQIATGSVGKLQEPILHFPYWNADDYFRKLARYTDLAAAEMHERGRRIGFLQLLTVFPLRFLNHYLVKRGCLDGAPGLVFALLSSNYVLTKYAKLWCLQRGLQREEIDPLPQPDSNGARHRAA